MFFSALRTREWWWPWSGFRCQARLARLVRLIRTQPELVTLTKGMLQAMRSVISAVTESAGACS